MTLKQKEKIAEETTSLIIDEIKSRDKLYGINVDIKRIVMNALHSIPVPQSDSRMVENVCEWNERKNYPYKLHDTRCGRVFSATPNELVNGFIYCPYCGGKLNELLQFSNKQEGQTK